MRAKVWKAGMVVAFALAASGFQTRHQRGATPPAQAAFDVRQCPPDTRSSPLARDVGTGTQASNVADDPGFNAPLDTPIEPAGQGLWIGGAPFTRADIHSARTGVDTANRPTVDVVFTDQGQMRFLCAQWGRVGRMIEISVDTKPVIRPYLRDMIYGHQLQISVGSVEESQKLAAYLMGNSAP